MLRKHVDSAIHIIKFSLHNATTIIPFLYHSDAFLCPFSICKAKLMEHQA